MIKAFLALASNRVIIDAVTNQLSIIDILEGIRAQSFPALIPHITFLFYVKRDAEDQAHFDASFICLADGKEIIKGPIAVNFDNGTITRAIVEFEGFAVPEAKELVIQLADGSTVLGSTTIPIEKIVVPPPHIINPSNTQVGH